MREVIGIKLKELREQRELSQEELAARLGVAQGTICDIERGRRGPSLELLAKISKFFGVSTDVFLTDEEPVYA